MSIDPNEIGPLDEKPKYGFTCLQVFLKIDDEQIAMEAADRIGSLLTDDMDFNSDDDIVEGNRTIIVATSAIPEMHAWMKGPGNLMQIAEQTAAFIYIPTADDEI